MFVAGCKSPAILITQGNMTNKPHWKDAPDWANYLGNDIYGATVEWWWFEEEPFRTDTGYDVKHGRYQKAIDTTVPTLILETRPLLFN